MTLEEKAFVKGILQYIREGRTRSLHIQRARFWPGLYRVTAGWCRIYFMYRENVDDIRIMALQRKAPDLKWAQLVPRPNRQWIHGR